MIDQTAHEFALALAMSRYKVRGSTETFGRDDPLVTDYMGNRGEYELKRRYGLKMNTDNQPQGDGGIDFRFFLKGKPRTIDVKTSPTPFNLLVKEADIRRCAEFLVLAYLDKDPNNLLVPDQEGDRVVLLGWENPCILQTSVPKVFHPGSNLEKPIKSYHRPWHQLRAMWQFTFLMEERTDEQGNFLRQITTPRESLRERDAQTMQVPLWGGVPRNFSSASVGGGRSGTGSAGPTERQATGLGWP